MELDVEVTTKLETEGWIVLRIWCNKLKKHTSLCADIVEISLNNSSKGRMKNE